MQINITRDEFELLKDHPKEKEDLRSEIRNGAHVIVTDEDGLKWRIDADLLETQYEKQ